jgi:hypothetical protein
MTRIPLSCIYFCKPFSVPVSIFLYFSNNSYFMNFSALLMKKVEYEYSAVNLVKEGGQQVSLVNMCNKHM